MLLASSNVLYTEYPASIQFGTSNGSINSRLRLNTRKFLRVNSLKLAKLAVFKHPQFFKKTAGKKVL